MSSITPPEYYFNGIDYNSQFFNTSSTSGVSINYANTNYLKRRGTATSIASGTLFNNTVTIGNSNLLQTGVNLNLLNATPAGTMSIKMNNGSSVAQTVMTLNSLGTSSFTGNSTTSTTSSNSVIGDQSTGVGSYFLTMSPSYTSSSASINGASTLLYTPTTSTISLNGGSGTLLGTATNASNVIANAKSDNTNYQMAFIITSAVANTTPNPMCYDNNGRFFWNPSTATLNMQGYPGTGVGGISLSGTNTILSNTAGGTALSVPNATAINFSSAIVTASGLTLAKPITSTNTTTPVSGQIGYNYISSTGIIAPTNNTPYSIGSFSIPAGTWLIIGNFNFTATTSPTVFARTVFELSLGSAVFGNGITQLSNYTPITLSTATFDIQYASSGVFNFTTTTNIYANVLVNVSAGSATVQCFINALRIA